MPSLTRRGESWLLRYYPLGSERQVSRSYATEEVAREHIREIERAHDRGEHWIPPELRPDPRLGAVAEAYLKDKARTLEAKTLIRYSEALDLFLRFLEEREPRPWTLRDLNKRLLQEGWDWLLLPGGARHGLTRQPTTAIKIVEVWQLFWEWAADQEDWEDLCPRPRRIEMPARPTPDPIAPSWEEYDRMLMALGETASPWVARIALVARFTGLRRMTLLRLPWRAILEDRLKISPHLMKGEYSGLELPLHPWIASELARWRRPQALHVVGAPAAELTGRGHVDRTLRRAWLRAGVDAEVWQGQPLHCVRAAIETTLSGVATPQQVIDLVLGHAGQGTGQRHYRDRARLIKLLWTSLGEAVARIPPLKDHPKINRLVEVARQPIQPTTSRELAAGDRSRTYRATPPGAPHRF